MEEQYKYYAFISYNHADEKWAKWLQHNLEYYHIPNTLYNKYPELPKKIRPVFWYKLDLSGTKLKEALSKELNYSKYLIVICSPNSAKSKWVNDEVTAFIEQGKGDKIIPFIIGGTPHAGNPEEECFPPSLLSLDRDEEIRGIDVRRKEGKSHALVDVITTMFGIRFDELWKRHERKQKKIRNFLISILTLILILSIFIYDYTRVKVEYYADFVDQWGVAVGVVPLTDEQVAHRNMSCRFEYRRIPLWQPGMYSWRLDAVKCVNSSGFPQEYSENERPDRYSIQEYEYSKESGKLIRINYSSSKGIVLLRHNIMDYNDQIASVADFVSSSESSGSAYISSSTTSMGMSNKSRIKRYVYERNSDGFIVKKTYHCNNDDDFLSSMTGDSEGIFGQIYQLDSMGRVVQVYYIGLDGERISTKNGVSGKRYQYEQNGHYSSVEYVDKKGMLVLNEEKWAKCLYKTDEIGNIIELSYYDEKGEACMSIYGYSKMTYKYDSRGNVIEESYYDENGEICMNIYGYSKVIIKYDSRGNVIENSFYDEAGEACMNSIYGFAKKTRKYDSQDNMIEQSYYDENGEACMSIYGYSKMTYKYDSRGNVIEESYYDENGEACMSNYGYSKMTYKYDSRGNVIEDSFYDEDGEACMSSYGCSKITYKYDSRGNVIEESFYDENGEACISIYECSIMKFKYDSQGNIIEESFYDEKGEACMSSDGYSKTTKKYDSRGNMIEISHYDEKGKACMSNYGYSKMTYKYDSRGNVIEESFYDEDGEACMSIYGSPKMTYKYDSRGNVIERSYYDEDGEACMSSYGCPKMTYKYDSRGNVIEYSFYDEEGMACMSSDGFAKATIKYDSRGNMIEYSYYDEEGMAYMGNYGFAKSKIKYDSRGNMIERSYYDENGEACISSYGYSMLKIEYNNRNLIIKERYYDADYNPTEAMGYFEVRKEYDKLGNVKETIFVDKDSNILSKQVATYVTVSVDGAASQQGVPVGSIILRWNNWQIGDSQSDLENVYEKTMFSNKDIYYITPEGKIGRFYMEKGWMGMSMNDYLVEKSQAQEWLRLLTEWENENNVDVSYTKENNN